MASSNMSTITPHYRNVQQLLQSQSFSIDEYQREYKWEKENIDELLSDLQGKFFNYYKQGDETSAIREGANKQVISSQADSLIKISRIWADFFPANTSNQPI